MIYHIIRARATALGRPDYFAVTTPNGTQRHVDMLKKGGWLGIEVKTIVNRDNHIEGCLKRCSLGGKNERAYLQAYYNKQP